MRKRQFKKFMKREYNITPLQLNKVFESAVIALREKLSESITLALIESQTTDDGRNLNDR